MPVRAGACGISEASDMQGIWLGERPLRGLTDCHGKEGVAGSSPAEGSRKPRYSAVSFFSDRFR
jgi:hypothetical protein